MSNYTKTTNFASKDNLSPGNPLKIVKGTEIDTEFNNIQTAVGTKTDNSAANITGGSITGITDLAVADGGTGASTATAALNNLLPTQTGNANKYLQTDGTNATWDAVSLSTSDITGTLPVANGGTGVTASTGTGSVVLSNSPTLVTPALGTPASGTATNLTGLPISTGVSGLGTGVATFLGTPSSANLASAVTDETGSGALVFANSPTLITPALGTPSALVGTNITGTASGLTAGNVTTNANLTGAVTSVGNATSLGSFSSANLLAALTDETGTGSVVFATSPTLVTPILGTPTSGTLTNATGLPLTTGVTGTLPIANGGTNATDAATARTNLAVAGTAVSNTFSANQIVEVTDNTNAALRITQLGTGNALLVEDSTNPDATPFIVNSNGSVISGALTAYTISGTSSKRIQSISTGGDAGFSSSYWAANASGTTQQFMKSRGTTVGDYTVAQNGDTIGQVMWGGADGAAFIQAASIIGVVDGTPGTNDMPGRLVFATTADGAASATERVRIASTGAIGLSGANYGTSGQVLTSGGSSATPTWTTVSGAGDVVGPASSTDNAFARFDTTTGKLLQNSTGATLSDTGAAVFTGALDVLGNSTAGSNIKLYEDTDNGSNYVSFKAPDTIAANVTWTLPTADGTSAQVLSTNGSGTLSWATAGGGSSQWTTTGSDIYYNTGRVGIGTTAPAKPLNVVSSATTEVWVESTSTQKAILSLSAGDTSVGITSTYNSGGSAARPFIFYNVSTPLLQFDAGKSVALQGASTQTGTGITFPATQSASSDANTLDDYEEGTYTPTDASGAGLSFSSAGGFYTKIGRQVICFFYITFPSTASTAAVAIGSLPFTTGNNVAGGVFTGAIAYNTYGSFQLVGGSSVTFFNMSTPTGTDITNVNMSGKSVRGSFLYFV